MTQGNRTDPYLAFNFLVEVEGLVVGGFSEVTGLETEIEFYDYREGGVNEYIHKFWGPTRYPSRLVLKRGLTDVDALWLWYQAVALGAIVRQIVSVVLLERNGEERARWVFLGAYPVRWAGPGMQAGTATVAVETLELVHRGFYRVT